MTNEFRLTGNSRQTELPGSLCYTRKLLSCSPVSIPNISAKSMNTRLQIAHVSDPFRNGPEWRRLRSAVHALLRREVVEQYGEAQAQVAHDLVTCIVTQAGPSHHQHTVAKDKEEDTRCGDSYVVEDLLPLLFRYTLEGEKFPGNTPSCWQYIFVVGQFRQHAAEISLLRGTENGCVVLFVSQQRPLCNRFNFSGNDISAISCTN